MTEIFVPFDHTPVRDVTSEENLVHVSIMCIYDGWTTSHSSTIAEEASDLAANDWAEHAPDIEL